MTFNTRHWVKPQDLNPNGTLFGGRILEWIDEEIGMYTSILLATPRTAVKHMAAIDFVSPVELGAIIEIGLEVQQFGTTSVTLSCKVRNTITHKTITTIDKIVMVALDKQGNPTSHRKQSLNSENS
jgi:acyl-CoA hydrolase